MAALKPWDGRALCAVELADSYYACEAAVPLMGVVLIFQKGETNPEHPYARRKERSLTYAEAVSLADGRFNVTKIETAAASDESKTDRARKKAAAAVSNESEG